MTRHPLRRTAVVAIAFATAFGLGVPQALAQPVDSPASFGSLALPTGSSDLDFLAGSLSPESLSLLDGALNTPGGIPLDDLIHLMEALGSDELAALEALLSEDIPGLGSLGSLGPFLPGTPETPDTNPDGPPDNAGESGDTDEAGTEDDGAGDETDPGAEDGTGEGDGVNDSGAEEVTGEDSTEPTGTDEAGGTATEDDAVTTPEGVDEDKVRPGDRTERADFLTPTVVVGCGLDGNPVTLGQTQVQPGPNWSLLDTPLNPRIDGGHARFSTIVLNDGFNFDTSSTDLKVLWVNVSTFKGGIAPMSNSGVLGLPSPEYSAKVDTGDGTVIAAVFGRVHYQVPTEESCLVLPTIGTTTVTGAPEA